MNSSAARRSSSSSVVRNPSKGISGLHGGGDAVVDETVHNVPGEVKHVSYPAVILFWARAVLDKGKARCVLCAHERNLPRRYSALALPLQLGRRHGRGLRGRETVADA